MASNSGSSLNSPAHRSHHGCCVSPRLLSNAFISRISSSNEAMRSSRFVTAIHFLCQPHVVLDSEGIVRSVGILVKPVSYHVAPQGSRCLLSEDAFTVLGSHQNDQIEVGIGQKLSFHESARARS